MPKRAKEKESIFDGITYSYAEGENSPFRAVYYVAKTTPAGKRKSQPVRKRFATELERDIWAKQTSEEMKYEGKLAAALDPSQRRRWELAQAMLDPWEDPVEVVREWRESHPRKQGPKTGRTAGQVVDEYMDRHEFEPGFDPSIYRSHFARFKARFGSLLVSELYERRDEIATWIERLDLAANTKRNQKSRVAVAFSEARTRGEIENNPFERLRLRVGRSRKEIEFMDVDDIIELFKANFHDATLCAKLSLGLHGGLRTSAVARVEWDDFRFSLKALETPAWKTKTGTRNLIQGWPAVVWKWVARAKGGSFADPCPNHKDPEIEARWKKSVGRKWMHQKARALKAAGLLVTREDIGNGSTDSLRHPPANWARHSFATYHATAFQDLALTSTLMSHAETVSTLRTHYLGVVEKPEALRFFQISPRLIQRMLASE
jgi:integrase